MKKNLFKKVTATVMSITMVVGMANVVLAAHAANGANVATQGWSSFSICTREDGGKWEDALKAVDVKDENGNVVRKQTYLQDYATEGYIAAGTTPANFDFYIKNTGWDGNWDPNGNLVGDNPWGMTATMTQIPIERGRYYTVSFKIKSTLKGTYTTKNSDGTETKETITQKHLLFKAYKPTLKGDDPGIEFISCTGATSEGYIALDSADDNWKEVTAKVKIPATAKEYDATVMGIKFAMGSMLVTYPKEAAQSGYIYVKDFKIEAGTQHTVTFTNGSQTYTSYVNNGERISSYAFKKAKNTLVGYKNAATGSMYNFNTAVTGDLKLNAVWTKTKAPGKTKITLKSSGKKKVKVTLKKVAKAAGYEIQYSANKKFKKAKKKTTTKKTYTIKKLKSGTTVYVKVRAYVKDSAGNNVYGKFTARKKAYVK